MNRIKIKKLVLRGDGLTAVPPERLRMAIKAGLASHKYDRRPRPRSESRLRLRVGPAPSPEQLGRMIAERICRVLNE